MRLSVNDKKKTKIERVSELPREQGNTTQVLEQTTHQLRERIKELNCLYGISKLVENSGAGHESIYQGTANLISVSWQYPESACARITVKEKVFETDDFQETRWMQRADIKQYGLKVGAVEVYYLEEKPDSDEGPFLKEERTLINAIAERLGHVLERLLAEAGLRDYRDLMFRAEQLSSLGAIGSTLAHQLNQPLTVIRMSIQKALRNLELTDCPEIVTEMLDDSLDQVEHVSSVVKRFLALGRISSKEKKRTVSIYEITPKTVSILVDMAMKAHIELIVDDSLKKLPTIWAAEGDIEQMCFILTQNAIQAAIPDKKQRLVIGGHRAGDRIELTFSDNCGGIEPDKVDRIFEPFFTTKSADQGTGLGLAILQQIMTNHQGSARVESVFGQGTSFHMTFPATPQ